MVAIGVCFVCGDGMLAVGVGVGEILIGFFPWGKGEGGELCVGLNVWGNGVA